MRLLFQAGSTGGGSLVSVEQLAARLRARGHLVTVLATRRPARLPLARRSRPGRMLERVIRLPHALRRSLPLPDGPPRTDGRVTVVRPDRAVDRLLREQRFDVAVAFSQDRENWIRLRALLAERGLPTVLVIHEATSVSRVLDPVAPAELVVTNAEAHTDAVAVAGREAITIRSVVEPPRCGRRRPDEIVFVNPIPGYGLERACSLAAARPRLRFAFVESWPLAPVDRWLLARRTRPLPNVDLRRRRSVDSLYENAAVLLVPYLDGNRPRVVAEAHALGVPVLAKDTKGLREAVRENGILVAPGAPDRTWEAALDRLWADRFARLPGPEEAAERLAEAEAKAAATATRFEAVLADLGGDSADRRQPSS